MSSRTLNQYLGSQLPTARFIGTPIYVYGFVSPSGVVAYIGRTWDPATRIGRHRAEAAWWTPDLSWAVIDIAYSWDEAKAMEATAIRTHRPVANIQHNARAA